MTDPSVISLFYPFRSEAMEKAALGAIRSGRIASGPSIERFERLLAAEIQRDHVVATSDMTTALTLSLRAVGVRPGQSVAALAFACLSTNAAISMVGAVPQWLDVDPRTVSMCPEYLRRHLTSETAAVVLYHVAGYPADTEAIASVCREKGVPLIEDCDNALGARYLDRPVGQHGDFAVYSFYPNRQINALDGGAVACMDSGAAERLRCLRRFGIHQASFRGKDGEINPASRIDEIGISAGMSEIHATVGCTQFEDLASRLMQTRANADYLSERLCDLRGVRIVCRVPGALPAHWGLLVMAADQARLLSELKTSGIDCSKLHLRNDIYAGFNAKSAYLPGTDSVSAELMALPCGWWLDRAQLDRIVSVVRRAVGA